MKIVLKLDVPIFNTLRELSRQRPSRSGWFIVLNDSVGPKMHIKNLFTFFPILFKGFRVVWMSSRPPIYGY